MNIDLIPAGDNPPQSVNVVIEVPIGGEPVKYEFDKKSGAIFVDRILHTAMRYPANYGFIPQTLGEDGDPLDCLVMARWPFMPGCVVRARPVAVLFLEDEAGGDEKLLAVPETQDQPILRRHHGRRRTCPRSCSSRSSISSPITKTSSPRNGPGSARGASREDAYRVIIGRPRAGQEQGLVRAAAPSAALAGKGAAGMNNLRKLIPMVRPIGSSRSGW